MSDLRQMTMDEIASLCDLDRHQIGRRLGEMWCRGLIRKTITSLRWAPTGPQKESFPDHRFKKQE